MIQCLSSWLAKMTGECHAENLQRVSLTGKRLVDIADTSESHFSTGPIKEERFLSFSPREKLLLDIFGRL